MKKSIFTLLLSFLFTMPAFAGPITLTAANLFNNGTPKEGIDSLAYIDPTSTFPSFAAAANHTWDLTGLKYNAYGAKIRYRGDAPFNYADSVASVFGPVNYWVHALNAYDLGGIEQERVQIDSQTNLIKTPGGWVDTFIIPYQVFSYVNKPAYYIMPFPATYKSNWNSSFAYSTYLNITDTALGLKKATEYRLTYVTETDSVIGWGTMKVNTTKTNAGTAVPSGGNSVLQLQIIRHQIDTFSFATGALYANLNLNQSYITNTYQQNFYCVGSLTPLASILFTDSTFSTVQSATINTSVLSIYRESVENIVSGNEMTVYPNPVTNGTVSIDVPGATGGVWSYKLMNASGRLQAENEFQMTGTHAAVLLPHNIMPGIYFLNIANNGQSAGVKVVEIK